MKQVVPIEYEICERQSDRIAWPTEQLVAPLKRAAKEGLPVVKIHSHPGDVGVGIRADGNGGIAHITGAVHYLQPDGSSLFSRQVFTLEDVQADALRRYEPEEFSGRSQQGYIKGAEVSRPAVMPINMTFSGLAVFEFVCRMRPQRDDGNTPFASQRWSFSNDLYVKSDDGERCVSVSRYLGRGDMIPLLGMPQLSEAKGKENAVR